MPQASRAARRLSAELVPTSKSRESEAANLKSQIAFPEVNLGALAKAPDHRDSVVWDASRMATPAEASLFCDSGTRPRRGAAGEEAEVSRSPPPRGV